MKHTNKILAVAFFSMVVTTHAQSVLDAPGEKKITVGSEIARGWADVSNAGSRNPDPHLGAFVKIMRAVLDRNKAANTDSEGFMLGATFSQWFHLDLLLRMEHLGVANDREEITLGVETAKEFFQCARSWQKKLGLDDAGLCKALGLTSGSAGETEIRELMAGYDATATHEAQH